MVNADMLVNVHLYPVLKVQPCFFLIKSLYEDGEKKEGHWGSFSGVIFARGIISPFLYISAR